MFKVLCGKKIQEDRELFVSMFQLRHRVFIEELKWPVGDIRSVDGMEFDQFDIPEAYYIVRVNDAGQVDACVRLLPTSGPYLLGEVFPDLINFIPRPNSDTVWETSRFCADRSSAPKNIVGQLLAAMLEFALSKGITRLVSVSDIRIEPLLKRAGLRQERIGNPRSTGTDIAAGEMVEVTEEALEGVREKSGIVEPLISEYVPSSLQTLQQQEVIVPQ